MPITTPASSHASSHVDVLDGMRALAIALVVWLHVWELSWLAPVVRLGAWSIDLSWIPRTGFVGVELFFFVSGCCLFFPHARHLFAGAPLQSLRTYAYKRAIKIVPSYLLAIALILSLFKPGFFQNADWGFTLFTHLIFIHDLFPQTEGAINGVFWSLGVEVQFYLLFPLFALAFRRWPFWTWLGMCLTAIGYRHWIAEHHPERLGFVLDHLPGYLDFFACGMLASYALVAMRSRPAPGLWRRGLATVGAIAAFGVFFWLTAALYEARIGAPVWPGAWQVDHRFFLGVAFLAIALCSAGAAGLWRRVLANPVMVFVSGISYNLYLWHQLIARELMARKIPMPATEDPHADPSWQLWFMLIAIGLSLLVATVITYGFERPLLRHGPGWLLGPLRRRAAPEREPDERQAA